VNLSSDEASPVLENPFFHRGPIRERRYFFGRTRETRQSLQMLCNSQCVSLVGPRHIGKTSFLLHLCDPEVLREHRVGDEHLFVYVDCQGLGDLNIARFYQLLWKEARSKFAERAKGECFAEAVSDFMEFRDAMIKIQDKGYRPAFLFDEFETVALNPNLNQDLFSDLRSLVPIVAYVTASKDSLYALTYTDRSVLSSPFFNIFDEIHLGFLKPGEAEEMVASMLGAMGQRGYFSENDLAFILEIGGYHPFFLQLAGYRLFEQKMAGEGLEAADYACVRQDFAEDAEAHFSYAWSNLTVNEREAVWLVSVGKGGQLGGGQKRRLEKKCILYGDTIFSSVFAEFVQLKMTEPETEEGLVEAKVAETAEEAADEVITHIDQAVLRPLEEIRGMLERFSFANPGILGNFEGFAVVEIADCQGNLVHPSREKSYTLSEGQSYELRVGIQSEVPLEGIFDHIRLTNGRDVDSVDFVVFLDCDSLRFEPDELEFAVGTKRAESTAKAARVVAHKGGHDLFIQIFQKNALVQVICLKLEIQ
jgi:AAA+ ATPase superfamily predicted ATPase